MNNRVSTNRTNTDVTGKPCLTIESRVGNITRTATDMTTSGRNLRMSAIRAT